jgi:hypothetical protein
MLNTNGRPGKAKWLLNHFPEYLTVNGKPHVLQVGTGRIRGQKSTAENAPWAFAPNEMGRLNIYGYIAERYPDKPDWWPWVKKTYVTQAQYDMFIESLNFHRNGGKTFGGLPGLDPVELIGGVREVGDDDYRCRRGIYAPVNVIDGEPATFNFDNGDVWTGDKPAPHIPTWN